MEIGACRRRRHSRRSDARLLGRVAETLTKMGNSALARMRKRHQVDTEGARLKALFEGARLKALFAAGSERAS